MTGISRVEISRNFPRERDLLERYSRDFPRRYFVLETRREQRDLLKDTEGFDGREFCSDRVPRRMERGVGTGTRKTSCYFLPVFCY